MPRAHPKEDLATSPELLERLPKAPGYGGHDQLFKDVLKAFFPDFLALVAPDIRAQLGEDAVTFLEAETFSDQPKGERRTVDLLARLTPKQGTSRLILAHVEIEREAYRLSPERMYRYYQQLSLKHTEPILPLALFLTGGEGGMSSQTYTGVVWGKEVVRFTFFTFGLSQALAEEYLARPEPLAWALAVMMKRGSHARWELVYRALVQLARAQISKVQQFLLVNLVRTYGRIDATDKAALEQALQEEPNPEVKRMRLTWADEQYLRGYLEAERKAELKGKREGQVVAIKNMTGTLLISRFGPNAHPLNEQLQMLDTPEALEAFFNKALSVPTLEELNLEWDRIARAYPNPAPAPLDPDAPSPEDPEL